MINSDCHKVCWSQCHACWYWDICLFQPQLRISVQNFWISESLETEKSKHLPSPLAWSWGWVIPFLVWEGGRCFPAAGRKMYVVRQNCGKHLRTIWCPKNIFSLVVSEAESHIAPFSSRSQGISLSRYQYLHFKKEKKKEETSWWRQTPLKPLACQPSSLSVKLPRLQYYQNKWETATDLLCHRLWETAQPLKTSQSAAAWVWRNAERQLYPVSQPPRGCIVLSVLTSSLWDRYCLGNFSFCTDLSADQ